MTLASQNRKRPAVQKFPIGSLVRHMTEWPPNEPRRPEFERKGHVAMVVACPEWNGGYEYCLCSPRFGKYAWVAENQLESAESESDTFPFEKVRL